MSTGTAPIHESSAHTLDRRRLALNSIRRPEDLYKRVGQNVFWEMALTNSRKREGVTPELAQWVYLQLLQHLKNDLDIASLRIHLSKTDKLGTPQFVEKDSPHHVAIMELVLCSNWLLLPQALDNLANKRKSDQEFIYAIRNIAAMIRDVLHIAPSAAPR